MLRIILKQVSYWLLLLPLATGSAARAESLQDQVLRLEATIKTLTVQNAELIKENDNLRKQMSRSISAKRAENVVVAGCDVKAMEKKVVYESNFATAQHYSEEWLKSNGERCTDSQLQQIMQNLSSWLANDYGMDTTKGSRRIISFILQNR